MRAKCFLWAVGPGNDLARHADRVSSTFDFKACQPLPLTPFDFAPTAPNADCPFNDDILDVDNDGTVLARNIVDLEAGTVTIQVEHNDEAWIGFAFSESRAMVPNTAVIWSSR